MIDNLPENLNKENDRLGIYHTTEGLDPKKYSRKISPYDVGNPEVEAALDKEMLEEYERDQEKAEREEAREKAQYLQDLKIIKNESIKSREQENILEEIPASTRKISNQELEALWNIEPRSKESLVLLKSILRVCGLYDLKQLNRLNEIMLFSPTSLQKVQFWFFKHYVISSILQLIQDWNEVNEESMHECTAQLVSESMEMVENMRESLLTSPYAHLQINFLVNIINRMHVSRYNESFNKIYTYAVLLLAELTKIEAFSVNHLPPDMETLLQNNAGTIDNEQKTKDKLSLQNTPQLIIEQESRAAFVAIFDTAQQRGIIKQMTDSAVAKLIGAKGKEPISAARNQKNSLSKKLYDFVLSLLQKAKLEELDQLEKDIKKIKANKFSNDEPLR